MAARRRIKIGIEAGSKRVFASAVDFPGWARASRTEDEAIARLLAYRDRYALIAARAGVMLPEMLAFDVVERVVGNGTTDFGAPDLPFAFEAEPLSRAQAGRLSALLKACEAEFTAVAAQAPAVLAKGPRGGGRDTEAVLAHVAEADAMAVKRKSWPERSRLRRRAWHLTDHAWEIEDRLR